MVTIISMLRGINVGGHNKILMNDLKDLYSSLGFQNVRTYIQSGNVVFNFPDIERSDLERMIVDAIKKRFDLDIDVINRTSEEIRSVLNNKPISCEDESKLYVTFLREKVEDLDLLELEKVKGTREEFHLSGSEIYLMYPDGIGRTKLNNSYIERKLKVQATTRNWRTVKKLNEMCSIIEDM